jgi:hypothetical protein
MGLNTLTINDVKRKIELLYGKDKYLVLSDKIDSQLSRIKVRHIPCGNLMDVQVKGFTSPDKKGHCKFCDPIQNTTRNTYTEEKVRERFVEVTNGEYEYIDGFINAHSKMHVRHKTCGNTFKVSSHMFFGVKKTRCPLCANSKRGKHLVKDDYLSTVLKEADDGEDYEWLEGYSGDNKKKIQIRHKRCNNEFLIRPNDFQQGYRCKSCNKSKFEKAVFDSLTEKNIDFLKEFSFEKCRGIKYPLPFDFVIMLVENCKLLIEVDSEFHEFENKKANDRTKESFVESREDLILRRIGTSARLPIRDVLNRLDIILDEFKDVILFKT